MRQGGSEACACRRLRKRTIPSSSVGFEEKSRTAPERGVKSGLPKARRKSRWHRGRVRRKNFFRDGGKKSAFRAAQRSAAAWQCFWGKCSGVLRALSAQDRSGLNAARLRIGVSGRVSLEGRNGEPGCRGSATAWRDRRPGRGKRRTAVVGKACGELRAGASEASSALALRTVARPAECFGQESSAEVRRNRRKTPGRAGRRQRNGRRTSALRPRLARIISAFGAKNVS